MRKERMSETITLYCGDCAEALEHVPPVDALVTDPPYGIGAKMSQRTGDSGHWRAELYNDMADWDAAPPPTSLLDLARSKATHQILWGGNYFELPPSRCWLVWHKTNNMPTTADCELAWTNMDRNVKAFDYACNGWDREHPTQKPVELMTWCLQQLPEGTRRILDPFMGSGTTGVACALAGLRFIGVEREEKYFDYACKRIEAALRAPRDLLKAKAVARIPETAQDGLTLIGEARAARAALDGGPATWSTGGVGLFGLPPHERGGLERGPVAGPRPARGGDLFG